ncbi:hypothetical protein ASF10_19275 [Flavobacterium sp. Leaf82]|uniref:hypothetical protein n=1 Tax=Flavobacterium sp. Leaf82 TaxID=1736238 RepID=UPI0006FE8A53|nr:hypothetical protein [Flavobacterium sp. Leaf82]KQO33217.1 hypothetical protein ASF10_19275 [Flavobacterium sp. Leaf82]
MNSHKLYDKKIFWIIREKKRQIKLRFNIFKFYTTQKFDFEKENLSYSRFYLFAFLKNIARAVLYVIFLFTIEYFTQLFYNKNASFLPTEVIKIITFLPKPAYPDSNDSVTQFISLIASVSGVLLALFYPILATIASTGYAKVNSSIRNLIFIEPVTQNYLRKLAFLTSYSILTLLLITFGFKPGNLVLLVLLFLSLTSLFSLLKLGAGVYNLFEPDTLLNIVNKDIREDIKNVTIKSVYWNNPNFQNHFRGKAEKNIDKIRLIIELSFDAVLINKQSFLKTISQTYSLLNHYSVQKSRIPVKSKWFKNKEYHKSFFETTDHIRQTSINTKTYVQSTADANLLWFEEEIFEILNELGKKLIITSNYEITSEYLLKSMNTLQYYGYKFEFKLADKLLVENLFVTENSFLEIKHNSYKESKANLILAETFARSLGNFQISFFNAMEDISVENFNNEVNKINWRKKESIYESKLPKHLYSLLEKYHKSIENEISIEGKKITPDWYIIQHCTAEYLILIEKEFTQTLAQLDKFINPLINKSKEKRDFLTVSFLCHLALELTSKIEFRISRIATLVDSFDRNNLYKGNFHWSKIEIPKIKEKIYLVRETIIFETSNTIEKINTADWNEEFPDIFGRSFSILAEELINCFNEKDLTKFKKLFTPFLKSSLPAFYSLYSRYKDKYIHHLEIAYQIHIELFQITGLSYIYSELTDIPFWNTAIEIWNESNFSKTEIEIFISSYTFYKKDKLGVGHNFHENNNRSKNITEFIEKNQIDKNAFKKNIISKYITNNNYRDNDYEEIFLEFYLLTFIEAKDSAMYLSKINQRNLFTKI